MLKRLLNWLKKLLFSQEHQRAEEKTRELEKLIAEVQAAKSLAPYYQIKTYEISDKEYLNEISNIAQSPEFNFFLFRMETQVTHQAKDNPKDLAENAMIRLKMLDDIRANLEGHRSAFLKEHDGEV